MYKLESRVKNTFIDVQRADKTDNIVILNLQAQGIQEKGFMKKPAYLSKSKMLRDFQKLKKVYSLWVVGNNIIFKIFKSRYSRLPEFVS